MLILNGKEVADHHRIQIRARADEFFAKSGRKACLAVVLVGEDPASEVYVRNKIKACHEVGLLSVEHRIPQSVTTEDVLEVVGQLNENPQVDGILVQLPLPKHISTEAVIDAIDPQKDPDGLTLENQGLLFMGRKRVAPCTPQGVMAILDYYKIQVAGQTAVVVGRSQIVGKPMWALLLEANASVSVVHSKSKDLRALTSQGDIVIVAAGRPRLFGQDHFKKGAVVVDVGIHRLESGKLCGDVRFEELEAWASAATPVPGGVGPMTITMLMANTLKLAELRS